MRVDPQSGKPPRRGVLSKRDNWRTPPQIKALFKAYLHRLVGSTDFFDPATYEGDPDPVASFTPKRCGLTHPWPELPTWLNPPYSNSAQWLERAARHGEVAPVWCLVPPSTDSVYWEDHVWPHALAIHFLRGRLDFIDEEGTPVSGNTLGSALVVFDNSTLPGQHRVDVLDKALACIAGTTVWHDGISVRRTGRRQPARAATH